ncbi:mobilization protein [Pedobacter agri]|uniref:mobilization protein n=1 Tax=Pedobacter agri TaxID=454586 RepID=UPI00292E4F2D|nr:mobilization protein [Pedobacter agri]
MKAKVDNEDERFTHPIRTRVTKKTYKRMHEIMQNSNCRSMGEVARKILSREKILMLNRDASMSGPMEELTSIRKELKSIGVNINQQTRHFHTAENESQRAFYFMRTSDLYKNVGQKVDRLLVLVSKLSLKWLRGS